MTKIDHAEYAGTTRCGVVLFFTPVEREPTGDSFQMIPAYYVHNGYPMTEALSKMRWGKLTELRYAGMFRN